MKTISVFDKNFSITESLNYTISIQVSLDGYSLLVKDIKTCKYIGLKQYLFSDSIHPDDLSKELKKVISSETLAQAEYQAAQLVYWTPQTTLIPAPLFDKAKLRTYFEFNLELKDNEAIYCHKSERIDSYIAYSIPSDIATIAGQHFSNLSFYNQTIALTNSVLQLTKDTKNSSNLLLYASSNFFDIALAQNGRLIFQNCYRYTNTADFQYFAMNIFEQFKLNPESVPLQLGGNISKIDDRYFALKKYIRNVQFADENNDELFSRVFIDKELHRLSALTNLPSCE